MPAFFVYRFRLLPARRAIDLIEGPDTLASEKLRNASEACRVVNDGTPSLTFAISSGESTSIGPYSRLEFIVRKNY
jgi:hypothetical protein